MNVLLLTKQHSKTNTLLFPRNVLLTPYANVLLLFSSAACCGLPRGPFGLLGGLEAVSYVTILTVLGWSAYRRLIRGAPGLPPGPLGLLPVAEGLSYAAAIGFVFVISVQILGNGWVPGALAPQSPCF